MYHTKLIPSFYAFHISLVSYPGVSLTHPPSIITLDHMFIRRIWWELLTHLTQLIIPVKYIHTPVFRMDCWFIPFTHHMQLFFSFDWHGYPCERILIYSPLWYHAGYVVSMCRIMVDRHRPRAIFVLTRVVSKGVTTWLRPSLRKEFRTRPNGLSITCATEYQLVHRHSNSQTPCCR